MSIEDHPVKGILECYYRDYKSLRDKNQELDNFNFHKQFGLVLGVPKTWPVMKSILETVELCLPSNVTFIYSSTLVYREINKEMEQKNMNDEITFFSWQELYVAMTLASTDVLHIQKFRNILQNSCLTVFLGAPGIPDIVDQVRGFCDGCLIVLL